MSKFGKELIESMQQAAQYAERGKVRGAPVTTVELPDVRAIRHPDCYAFGFEAVRRLTVSSSDFETRN